MNEEQRVRDEKRADADLLRAIAPPLLRWYGENARAMPWRSDPAPYNVWVSEIMLQQTRVEAGRAYYLRFVDELPDVEALANVSDERLMKLWEGLGYYSRARNLKKAAGIVMEQYGGRIPERAAELGALPGIGPYTAGAIASIAFGESVPAVDGNVLRVLARLLADPSDITKERVKKAWADLLRQAIPGDRPGDFNQALMEVGALVCIPGGAPRCGICPLAHLCRARSAGSAGALPVKSPGAARRIRPRTLLLLVAGDTVALRRRPDKGLLAGLWELPGAEGHLTEREAFEQAKAWGFAPASCEALPPARHVFSHVEWDLRAYRIRIDRPQGTVPGPSQGAPRGTQRGEGAWRFAGAAELADEIALPAAFQSYRPHLFSAGDMDFPRKLVYDGSAED